MNRYWSIVACLCIFLGAANAGIVLSDGGDWLNWISAPLCLGVSAYALWRMEGE